MAWQLKITMVQNGYLVEHIGAEPGEASDFVVFEEDEKDELEHHESLLLEIMEYFNFQGSKHDPERIRVIREKRED